MKTFVIIPAAGAGTRFGSDVPKPLLLLKGKEVLIYSLEVFDRCDLVEGVVVVAPPERVAEFERVIKKYPFKKSIQVVAGGQTRYESVNNGLKLLDPNIDFVLIHDGARPLVSLKVVEEAIKTCYATQAVVVGVPLKPTIKRIDPKAKVIDTTLDRTILWEAQTPQVFAYELLTQAHRQGAGLGVEITDDAFLVERYGAKIKMIEGEYRNVKITTPEDLKIAEALLG
jgi:2-C-methyl-D-erythritol 4-phosphate cytidylyltransferase